MNKQLFSLLSLGVFSVAVAGFGLPAEGGLFDFFRHHGGYYDCGPCGVVDCAPACGYVVCAPACGYDYDDDDHFCGYGACGYSACAPAPVYHACACPPPVTHSHCGYCGYDYDDDDDCDDDD